MLKATCGAWGSDKTLDALDAELEQQRSEWHARVDQSRQATRFSMRVFDSNILIYHLNDALSQNVRDHVERWVVEGASISVITRMEVLGFRQTAVQLAQASRFIALFDEVALGDEIVERTIALRQQHRIRLPDAIIAATALNRSVALASRDEHAKPALSSRASCPHARAPQPMWSPVSQLPVITSAYGKRQSNSVKRVTAGRCALHQKTHG